MLLCRGICGVGDPGGGGGNGAGIGGSGFEGGAVGGGRFDVSILFRLCLAEDGICEADKSDLIDSVENLFERSSSTTFESWSEKILVTER
jgi:hypothetical protein